MADDGDIIYHPYRSRIQAGQYTENTTKVLTYEDGVHVEQVGDTQQIVNVNTVSYTGCKAGQRNSRIDAESQ